VRRDDDGPLPHPCPALSHEIERTALAALSE
jgi:hypothetical protein